MKLFTRYRILNATRALVSEVGVERVTMRGIAKLANLTAPAIYKHFRNKRDLLDHVIAHAFDELDGEMLRGYHTPSAARGLRTMSDEVLRFATRYPKLTEMMLAPRTIDRKPLGRLEVQVERCMQACVMRPAPSGDIALLLWAQMRGVLSRRRDEPDERLRAAFDGAMLRVLRPLAEA
ncbi:MAG: TetR/AcrR family transcriptional regulator [Myxococcales bacterium]|nr:TetR/AcrR family transcriptional regulator [Myxococcales bacterium]